MPRLGSKAFQQSAGFLRVRGGRQPLDNSAVHPESYYRRREDGRGRRRDARSAGRQRGAGQAGSIRGSSWTSRPGCPRSKTSSASWRSRAAIRASEFRVPQFAEGVHELADLREGMILEGVVTNVTRFGAFVDVGVHQDGLIHISELDRRFVKDPTEVVAVGDIVRVKVLQVDAERRRIALSRKQAMG